MRAERINPNTDQCYILTETKTQHIFQQIEAIEPQVVIIDSIQTLHTEYIESGAGSISQIRETTTELIQFAKGNRHPSNFNRTYYQRRKYCRTEDFRTHGRYRFTV